MKLSDNLDDCPVISEDLVGQFLIIAILNLLFGASAPRPPLKPPVPRDQLDKMIEAAEKGEEVELGVRVTVSGDTLKAARDQLVGIA